ncbi:hypothetical protein H3C61_03515 [Candidatus Gracilibacteria bacterium]|nr:hypothetical protein [Candidatus Gracilibacteria bacterium]
MDKNILNILQELYQIDESLKSKEQDLIKLIEKMILLKPNIKVDIDFKNKLKNELFNTIASKKIENFKKTQKSSIFFKFGYFFGGAIATAFGIFIFNQTLAPINNTNLKQNSPQIVSLENKVSTFGIQSENNIIDSTKNDTKKELKTNEVQNDSMAIEASPKSNEILLKNTSNLKTFSIPIETEHFNYKFDEKLNLKLKDNYDIYKVDSNLNSTGVEEYEIINKVGEKDIKNILKVANFGGYMGGNNSLENIENTKYTTLNLINPTLKYIKIFDFKNEKSEEFLIPVIKFEIKNNLESNYQKEVIVPLLKDFYEYNGNDIIKFK